MLEKYGGKHWQQVIGEGSFPPPISLHENISYVRNVLKNTVQFTSDREDYKKLDGRIAQLMHRAAGGEMTFGELLGVARTTVIDLDREANVGSTGANMSEVVTVGKGADMQFYKDEEPLVLTSDIYKQKFMTTKEGQAKYGKLLPFLTDLQNMCLNQKLVYPQLSPITNEISGLITGYAEAVKAGTVEAYNRRTEALIDFRALAEAKLHRESM